MLLLEAILWLLSILIPIRNLLVIIHVAVIQLGVLLRNNHHLVIGELIVAELEVTHALINLLDYVLVARMSPTFIT